MASVSPAPASTDRLAEASRSLDSVEMFLGQQRLWLSAAIDARKDGHPVECIYLCLQQWHVLLRKGLWLTAQRQTLQTGKKLEDDFLFQMLTHPSDLLPTNVPDRELYAAAEKHGFITSAENREMTTLYRQTTMLMRQVFTLPLPEGKKQLDGLADDLLRFSTSILTKLDGLLAECRRSLTALA